MINKTKHHERGAVGAIIAVFLVIGIGVAAYFFLSNPKKYLVDSKIAPDTSTEESLRDKIAPRDEIKESGLSMNVVVKPSKNNVISGTVTITATEVVEEAAGVGFFIAETQEALTEGGMPSLGIDRSGADGWTNIFDTTEYANGKYYVSIVAWEQSGEGPPLGVAQIPVEIKN